MILIGMLHFRKDPNSVKKAYAYAAVAKLEGVELIYFTPNSVDFDNKVIYGFKYQNGKWEKVKERFPDVIYRTGLSSKFSSSKEVLKKLRQMIPFTSSTYGDKMTIYKSLQESKELSQYLINSSTIRSFNELNHYLQQHQQVVLKSNRGHRGTGVIYIKKLNTSYVVNTNETIHTFTQPEFENFMINKLHEKTHHIQPYIECKTKSGIAYMIRSQIQKNGDNQWVVTALFTELAPQNSVIANLNCGGTTNFLDDFLYDEFGEEYIKIIRQIQELSYKIATHLEKYHYNKGNICELGIDIGIDQERKLWVFEINDLPGSPVTFDLELDVVKNLIKYAITLAKNLKKRGEDE